MKNTFEEAAKNYANIPLNRDVDTEERYFNDATREYDSFIAGAKWQQERSYSGGEVITLLQLYRYALNSGKTPTIGDTTEDWFEQFKKG